jgi:hypothetical protein
MIASAGSEFGSGNLTIALPGAAGCSASGRLMLRPLRAMPTSLMFAPGLSVISFSSGFCMLLNRVCSMSMSPGFETTALRTTSSGFLGFGPFAQSDVPPK